MNRSTRPSRPGLTGSASKSLLLSAGGGGVVLKAEPDTTTSTSLAWTEPNYKPDDYRVERSTDGITFSTVTTVANSVFTYTDTGLTESTEYWYRIVPILGGADQTASNVANTWTVPDTPTSLTATAASQTQINLAWTDVSTGNTAQVIERRSPAGSGSYTQIATTTATATTYSDTGLTASTQYEYRVAATNPATQSAYSTAANATTQSATPTAAWSIDWSSGTPSGYTFTRASTGTYVDSSGYIASANTDVARLTHNSSGSRLGLLVEEQRVNLVLQSADFTTSWNALNCTVTGNSATSPENTTTADLIKENSVNDSHGADSATITSQGSGNAVCVSVYAKKPSTNGRDCVGLGIELQGGGYCGRRFDLTNGTGVGSDYNTNTTNFTNLTSGIEDAGNGWYRCWMSVQINTSGNFDFRVSPCVNSTTPFKFGFCDYAGDNTSGVLVWGAQCEKGDRPTSYIPTTTASVTRSADLAHVLDSSITGWQDPGALVIHFYPPGKAGTLLSTDDTSAEQLGIQASSTTDVRAFWSNGQTATGTMTTGVQKAVHYWSGTASSFCLNGGTVQTGTNNIGTFGNIDFVTFGSEATVSGGAPSVYSQFANCVIRKIEFYAGTLSSGDLQTITA